MPAAKVILLVDDELLIAMTEAQQLRMEGYEVEIVSSGEKAVARVNQPAKPVDLVLMDIDLGPGMDGTQAAQAILKNADIPILFLSSHTEPAVVAKTESITSYGYVVKNSGATVLSASIKMAFKLHAAHHTIRQTNDHLHLALKASLAGTWEWDFSQGRFSWSPEIVELFGLPASIEQSRAQWLSFVHPQDRERVWGQISEATSQKQDLICDFRVLLPGGDSRWVRVSGKTDFASDRPVRMTGLCMDITARKQVENALRQSEAKFRAVVDNSYDGILFCDAQARIRYRSLSAVRIAGFTDEERMGRCLFDRAHPDDLARMEQYWAQVIENPGTLLNIDYRFQVENGAWRWLRLSTKNLLHNPDIQEVVITSRDITEQRETEEALRKWGQVFSRAGYGITFGSADGKLIELCNPTFARMHGYEVEELTGKPLLELFAPETWADVPVQVALTHQKGHHVWESVHLRKDGSRFPVSIDATTARDEHGRILYRLVNVQDISERKQMEEDLQASEERFRHMFEDHDAVMLLIEPATGKILNANRSAQAFYGYSLTQLQEMTIGQINLLPQEVIFEEMQKAAENHLGYFVFPHRLASGEERTVEVHSSPLVLNGKPALFSIIHDITGRKLAEIDLRKKNAEIENFFDSALDLLCIASMDGVFVRLNQEWSRVLGYSLDELQGHPFMDFVHPEDQAPTRQMLTSLEGQNAVRNFINRYRCKDGSYRWIEWRSLPDGALIYAAARDITARIQMQQALQKREEKYRSVVTAMNEGVVMQDRSGVIVAFNQAAERILGLSTDDILGRTSFDPEWRAIHPDGRLFQGEEHPAMHTLRTGEAQNDVIMGLQKPGGQTAWISINSQPVWTAGGPQPEAVVTSFTDITERRQMEENLRASEARYRQLAETVSDVIWILDFTDQRFRYISPSVERLRGYTAEEALAQTTAESLTPESLAYLQSHTQQRVKNLPPGEEVVYVDELAQPCKDGSVVWTECVTKIRQNPENGHFEAYGVSRDITQRKQAEAALRESEANLQRSLGEKVVLMRELQHRVKNSLSIAAGLLMLEENNLPDERTRTIFAETRGRLHSLAGVYEQLYRRGSVNQVDLRDYIEHLVEALRASYLGQGAQVQLLPEVDAISLNLDQALPLGIIMNELITNALKYAFPSGQSPQGGPGKIHIRLARGEGSQARLVVADNGVGIPAVALDGSGMGLELVKMLVQQIGGSIALANNAGCTVSVSFTVRSSAG